MICPYCTNTESKVVDKSDSNGVTRRRRECLKCEERFTTHETLERAVLRVIKKDGGREDFDPDKLRKGILKACEKRPVSDERIEKMMKLIEEKLRRKGSEVTSMMVGELSSKELKKVDKIAYIRFASVYRDFTDISDFKKEIKELVGK